MSFEEQTGGAEFDDFAAGFNDEPESTPSETGQQDPHIDNQQQTEQQEAANQLQEEMFKLRYNHEDIEVPLSEAQMLAQKGMNYDRIVEKLQAAEQDPARDFLNDIATQNGMTVEDFINAYHESRHQAEVERMSMENSIPQEVAEELLLLREDRLQREAAAREAEQEQMRQEEYLDFFQCYKELNSKEFDPQKDMLPEDVWNAHEQGVPLRYAYMEHFIKEQQNKLKVLEQNQQNAQRSPITSTTNYGSSQFDSDDEFIIGFNSV